MSDIPAWVVYLFLMCMVILVLGFVADLAITSLRTLWKR